MSAAQPATPRRRGPARGFTRDEVVRAALDELRQNGINAVSFRSVSRRLGVNPMALYTYVADKEELLAAMYDHVFRAIGDVIPDEAGDPKRVLVDFFTAGYRLMVEYVDLSRLVRPSAVGLDLDLVERVYRLLADLGVAEARIADVHLALLELTIGSAVAADARVPPAGQLPDDPAHPLLSAVLRRAGELNAEDHFVRTFGLLLDALVNGEGNG
ncbi:TetR/AcrR family transcriptional regulator [Amycolatopsis sp. GM8]|uniref:TetR/AcrR family transcriptional regulator n=1 Tax=Amycolatopsis sp. GM8 TaxID=2896530 RepID=UPI001F2EF45B|nr:TetR/AcrR family transcriptional regulator [Amycolatopsis sp. GM8]